MLPLNSDLKVTCSAVVLSSGFYFLRWVLNSHLFPSKWACLPAWVQMGLGCFESRKKAKCIELGRTLVACWHLLWAWAFLHKSLSTRTLLMLFCDCLLQITPFTFNLLEMDWTFSLLLEGAHFSDGICEEVLNQTGTLTKKRFKIRIGAHGQSLATVACSSVLFVLCLGWEHGRRDAFRIQVIQACPQLFLSRQVSFQNTSSPSYGVGIVLPLQLGSR